jgi:hypothetical protein
VVELAHLATGNAAVALDGALSAQYHPGHTAMSILIVAPLLAAPSGAAVVHFPSITHLLNEDKD